MTLRATGAVASSVLAEGARAPRVDRADAPMRQCVDRRPRGDATEISFEDLRQWVWQAVKDAYKRPEDDSCDGPWICEVYVDHVIFDLDGKAYRVGYTLDLAARTATLVGTAVEVQREWVEVPAAPAPEAPAPAAPPLPVGAAAVAPLDSAKASRRRIRVDFVAPIHTDPRRADGILATPDPSTGFLHLDGRLTRTGVFVYRDGEGHEWGELRTDEEVFATEAMASFERVVVTDDHPSAFVDVRNVKDVQVGHVGSDVRRDGEYVRASITITDAATIALIQAGKKELSCGYTAECVADSGELNGQRYDQRQTKIRGNHVAIVDRGRAGPECALIARGDGAAFTVSTMSARADASTTPPEKTMNPKKLIADALAAVKAHKVKDAQKLMGSAVEALKKARRDDAAEKAQKIVELLQKGMKLGDEMLLEAILEQAAKIIAGEAAPAETPNETPAAPEGEAASGAGAPEAAADEEEEEEQMADDAVKLRARVDALEAARKRDQAEFAARVDARTKLVADARTVCPDLDPTGKSDEAIMRHVVLAVDPEAGPKLDANKAQPGYLLARYEDALELHSKREHHSDELRATLFGARDHDDENGPDAARAAFLARRDERSRPVRRSN